MKRRKIKEVRYSNEEWNRVIRLAEKKEMLPAAYIRETAVEGEFLICDVGGNTINFRDGLCGLRNRANDVAAAVNTEKAVYGKDVEELNSVVNDLRQLAEKELHPFLFRKDV